MPATARTYDPNRVRMALGSIIPTGFSKDKKIKVRRLEPGFNLYVGCDGQATRSLNRNRSGEVTFYLQASSPTNDLLSALHNADLELGTGVLPFGMQDLNGTTVVDAAGAWIKQIPDFEKAKETGEVEWTLEMGRIDIFLGGNYL